ncbi:anthranilate phosphoribosyltransferase [bacterium]|jgi:anthranilate phosphoribosyltransferase|nr:anthranilate phosphoribosyltransferase [bacterium]
MSRNLVSYVEGALESLSKGISLSEKDSFLVLSEIFCGKTSHENVLSLLRLINQTGITHDEVVGFALAMRKGMSAIDIGENAVDTCGTGGSGLERFNISTASAFVVSACGIPVAKHGNHGSSKPNGSFDFLKSLGVNFELSPQNVKRIFDETKLCFLYARSHHPAVRFVGPARKEIGERTIFNLLGPLCNPAQAKYQVIGTTSEQQALLLARSLQKLGTKRSLVVCGGDGVDEFSIGNPSEYYDVSKNAIDKKIWDPSVLNLCLESNLEIGDGATNAASFKILLNDKGDDKIIHLISINAGAAIYCTGNANSIEDGYNMAIQCFQSGLVQKQVERFISLSNSL